MSRECAGSEVPGDGLVLIALTLLNVVAVLAFNLMPTVVEGAQLSLHLSPSAVGVLSASIMAGNALGSVLSKFWIGRWTWSTAARVHVIGQLAANGLSMLVHAQWPFFGLQFICGLFSGSLYSLTLTVLARGATPDRDFGIVVAAQVVSQALGLLAGPALVAIGGINAVLGVFFGFGILSIAAVQWIPATRHEVADIGYSEILRKNILLALLGCAFFFASTGAYWTYVELIGQKAGFSSSQIAGGLVIGVGAGFMGAVSAAWCGTKIPRDASLAGATLLVIAAVIILSGQMSLLQFGISCCLFNFAWNFALTYQYAVVNAIDASGRAVALTPAFHAAGASAGPAIAALFVGSQQYFGVLGLIIGGSVVSLACFFLATAMGKRTLVKPL